MGGMVDHLSIEFNVDMSSRRENEMNIALGHPGRSLGWIRHRCLSRSIWSNTVGCYEMFPEFSEAGVEMDPQIVVFSLI
jgi:hypothetical protein